MPTCYTGFIYLLVCCAQIGLGLLQISSFVSKLWDNKSLLTENALCVFMLFYGAQYNFEEDFLVLFLGYHL